MPTTRHSILPFPSGPAQPTPAPVLPADPQARLDALTDAVFDALLTLRGQLRDPDRLVAQRAALTILNLEMTRLRHAKKVAGTTLPSEECRLPPLEWPEPVDEDPPRKRKNGRKRRKPVKKAARKTRPDRPAASPPAAPSNPSTAYRPSVRQLLEGSVAAVGCDGPVPDPTTTPVNRFGLSGLASQATLVSPAVDSISTEPSPGRAPPTARHTPAPFVA